MLGSPPEVLENGVPLMVQSPLSFGFGMSQAFECLFDFVDSSDWYALCTASKLFNIIFKRFVQRIQNDIAMGKSLIGPIPVRYPSTLAHSSTIPKLDWIYITQNVHWRFPTALSCSCGCTGDCTDCQCTVQCGYHYKWMEVNGHSIPILNKAVSDIHRIHECHEQCSCSPSICKNRVTQTNHGISFYLQYDPNTQWGLHCDHDILRGQFVIEFVGEILDKIEMRSREIKNYMLTVNEKVVNDTIFSVTIDPRKYGNAARFINHSCDPNLEPQLVWTLTDIPSIKLFALRDIRKGEELTFHYGVIDGARSDNIASSQRCHCRTEKCQRYLPHHRGT